MKKSVGICKQVKLFNRFFWTWVLYGHYAVKEISTRMLKSPSWKCSKDLSLYNLYWILLCIYFIGHTGVLPILVQELVHGLRVSTSQGTGHCWAPKPFPKPLVSHHQGWPTGLWDHSVSFARCHRRPADTSSSIKVQ